VDFGFVGETKATLRALLPHLNQKSVESHLKESLEHYQKTRKGLDDIATANSHRDQFTLNMFTGTRQLAAEDAIFTCDVGTHVRSGLRDISG